MRDSGLNGKSGKCKAGEIQEVEGVHPPTKRRQHHCTIREVKGTIKERKGKEKKKEEEVEEDKPHHILSPLHLDCRLQRPSVYKEN